MTSRQSSLLIDESPLQVIPSLAKAIGLNEAIMIQQIHYWQRISPHEQAGRRWVPMSAPDLAEKFQFWSEKTIKRTVSSLKEKGLLIITKKSSTSWERSNWYAVDYDTMNSLGSASGQNDPMHRDNLTRSIGTERPDGSGQNDPMSNKGKNKQQEIGASAFVLPDWIKPETWQAYEEMRKKIRKPMTERARDLIIKKLLEMKQAGQDANAVLEQSVMSSWTGIFPIKTDTSPAGKQQPWWTDDQATLAKAKELGVSTNGISWQQLRSKIREKIDSGQTRH